MHGNILRTNSGISQYSRMQHIPNICACHIIIYWVAKNLEVRMKKIFFGLIVSGSLLLPIYGYGQMGMMEGMMNMSMVRHHFVMQNGVDPNYASKVNLLEETPRILQPGRNCMKRAAHSVTE